MAQATLATLITATLRELSARESAISEMIVDAIGQACIREQGSRSACGMFDACEGFDCACSAPLPTVVCSLPSEQGIAGIMTLSDACDALIAELDSQADSDARIDYVLRGVWARLG